MVNGAFKPRSASGDLGFERGDALLALFDRQRVEILRRKLAEEIVLSTGKILVDVHRGPALTGGGAMSIRPRIPPDLGSDESMSVPETMRAIDPEAPGGPEVLVLVERPVPQPGPGEVLVRVAAAGVNRPEVAQRMGVYPPPPGAPSILGLELSGTIVAVGADVPQEMIGQPVCALVAGGSYAEYAVAPLGTCLNVPEALSMVEAAAMPETLFTVWSNVFERAYAAEGETLLVHGGTSGIGTMAIGLARLFGLTIVVTCGSDDKCEAARRIGADHAINYRTEDFVARVKEITGGMGVDVVLDMVGGDYLPRNLQCLADDGRHVSIAAQRGAEAAIPLWHVMRRRLVLTGSLLRPRDLGFKSLLADEIARNVWPAVAEGRLRPVIDAVFPLEQAAEAHRRMEAGELIGKIVLTMQD